MCGISGVISNSKISIDSFLEMNQVIRHRGPDDEGFVLFDQNQYYVLGSSDTAAQSWVSDELYSPKANIQSSTFIANVGFGHRRLSILDLSSKGHQPLCSKDERYWITFNGEVYNYLEIRKELIELGYIFNTNTDTEVIISAYQEWGVECQHRFNGMWAFAIYDRLEKNIFLSRDRFGIKPIYYWFSPEGDFYFASEIKQFTKLPGWSAILNKERAIDYLCYAITDHTEETLFKGVYALPPSHFVLNKIENVLLNTCKLKPIKWYSLKSSISKITFENAQNEFLKKFKDSVNLHLRADVHVGSALSGGIDSSSIVSYVSILLKQENKSKFQKTFSSCSEDSRYDERNWMEEVVKQTQVEGHYVYPKGEDIFKLTEKLIWHMDEPYQSQSAFLGYHVFQTAKQHNVLVLLNGQGADEYLSGYSSYRILRQKDLVKRLKLFKLYREVNSLSQTLRLILHTAIDKLPNKLRYELSFLNKKNRRLKKIINLNILDKERVHPYQLLQHNNQSQSGISSYQLFKDPLQKYLRWEDRNSMAHSVEARVPFLDYRLIEFVHSLPLDYLDAPNHSKRILVEALKGILPEKVRNRKDKKGFITPEQKWFMTDFSIDFLKLFDDNIVYAKGMINSKEARRYLVEMQKGLIPFDYSYWQIILFCVWMKTFKITID
jgi:asparagine synthase (glutamine-hydrolysing)